MSKKPVKPKRRNSPGGIIHGTTTPLRNISLYRIPKHVAHLPKNVTVWVIGPGGPGSHLEIGSKKFEFPALSFPASEHSVIAELLYRAGKKSSIHTIDISRINLFLAKLHSSGVSKTVFRFMKKDQRPSFKFHRMDMDKIEGLPAERPHIITMKYMSGYLENIEKTLDTVFEALAPQGIFVTDGYTAKHIQVKKLTEKYNLEFLGHGIFKKKEEKEKTKEK